MIDRTPKPGRRVSRLIAGLIVASASAALAACADDESNEGGEIVISRPADPYRLDPAYGYPGAGRGPVRANEEMSLVYTPLLAYRHAEGEKGAELIPGLAQDLPDVSRNGRTYELSLRERIEYSDGTAVVASDFEHSVKRLLTAGSGGAPFYGVVEGVDAYLESGDPRADISGIDVNDETGEISIVLTEPDPTFSNVLAMWFSALVPGDTPFRDLTGNPPLGVGPYEVTRPGGREFVLAKSARFPDLDIPDIPTGNVDTITVKLGDGVARGAREVLDNKLDYAQGPVPGELRRRVLEQANDRSKVHTAQSTAFVFMDTGRPPFDDPKVREAVGWGIDRPALAGLDSGELEPGCSLLPPATPGHDPDFDTVECPYGDPSEPPDLRRARELIGESGAKGAPVAVSGGGQRPAARAFAKMLDAIGLDAELEGAGGARRAAAQTGIGVWFEDFPHPLNVFGPAAALSKLDDPEIDRRLELLTAEPDLDAVADEWGELTELVVSPPGSYLLPFGHRTLTTVFSERIDAGAAHFHPVYFNDYSSFVLKEGER